MSPREQHAVARASAARALDVGTLLAMSGVVGSMQLARLAAAASFAMFALTGCLEESSPTSSQDDEVELTTADSELRSACIYDGGCTSWDAERGCTQLTCCTVCGDNDRCLDTGSVLPAPVEETPPSVRVSPNTHRRQCVLHSWPVRLDSCPERFRRRRRSWHHDAMPRWAWLASLAIACGQPASASQPRPPQQPVASVDAGIDAPRSLAEDLPALALRARLLYLDWAAAFADATIDCATATSRVSALADKNADVAAANKAVFRAGHERVKAFRAELDKYEAEMMPAAKAIMESPIMARCSGDAAFARAIDRLQGDA